MNGVPFSVVDLSSIFTYFIVQINYKPKVQYCWLKNHIILFILICLRSWASNPLSFQTACFQRRILWMCVCVCVSCLCLCVKDKHAHTYLHALMQTYCLFLHTLRTLPANPTYPPTYSNKEAHQKNCFQDCKHQQPPQANTPTNPHYIPILELCSTCIPYKPTRYIIF